VFLSTLPRWTTRGPPDTLRYFSQNFPPSTPHGHSVLCCWEFDNGPKVRVPFPLRFNCPFSLLSLHALGCILCCCPIFLYLLVFENNFLSVRYECGVEAISLAAFWLRLWSWLLFSKPRIYPDDLPPLFVGSVQGLTQSPKHVLVLCFRPVPRILTPLPEKIPRRTFLFSVHFLFILRFTTETPAVVTPPSPRPWSNLLPKPTDICSSPKSSRDPRSQPPCYCVFL